MKSILFLTFLLCTPVHKFYVSLSDIRFNPESEVLEIATKIFIDDLEFCVPSLHIGESHTAENEVLIATYLLKEMSIMCNDNFVGLNFIGYEIEDDVIWCYVESDKISNPETFHLEFTFLIDELDQQTNIIHFKKDETIKSVFLSSSRRSDVVVFMGK